MQPQIELIDVGAAVLNLGLVLPIVGVVLIMTAAVLVWRRPLEASSLTAMLIAGAALLLLSDQGIRNFKLSATGLEVTRDELKQATVDYTKQIAKLGSDIEEQKRIVAEQSKLLGEHQSRLDGASPASAPDARAKPSVELNKIQEISDRFARNSKYAILVFYRTGTAQKAAGDAMAAEFLKRGFQSSATNTDLNEIVPQLSGERRASNVLIVAKSAKLPILSDVQAVVEQAAAAHKLNPPTLDDEEWTFKRGDVQIYIF